MWLFYTWVITAPFLQNFFSGTSNNPFFGSYRLVDKHVGGEGFSLEELLDYNRFFLLAFVAVAYLGVKGTKITYKRIETPFLIFIAAVAVSCLYSHSPIHTFRVLFDTFVLNYVCYLVGKNVLVDEKLIKRFVFSAMALGLTLAVTCFVEYALHRNDYEDEIYRVCGPFLYWENLAISVSLIMFICIYAKIVNKNKVLDKIFLVLIGMLALANFMTQTRTIMVGGIVGLACVGLVGREFVSRRLAVTVTTVVAVAVLALTIDFGSLMKSNFYQKTVTRRTDKGRTEWYFVALRVIEKHPLFGIGFRNFEYDKLNYVTPQEIRDQWVTARGFLHNSYLAITSESGFMALIPALFLLAAIFRTALECFKSSDDRAIRAWGVCMLGMTAVYVISATSFDPWFEPTMDNKLFYLCLGITVRKLYLAGEAKARA